jgi:hypothetical protein
MDYRRFIGLLRRNRGFGGTRVKKAPIHYTHTENHDYSIATFLTGALEKERYNVTYIYNYSIISLSLLFL